MSQNLKPKRLQIERLKVKCIKLSFIVEWIQRLVKVLNFVVFWNLWEKGDERFKVQIHWYRRNNMKEKNECDKQILLSEGWSDPRWPTQIWIFDGFWILTNLNFWWVLDFEKHVMTVDSTLILKICCSDLDIGKVGGQDPRPFYYWILATSHCILQL